jgi:hypothetical protein
MFCSLLHQKDAQQVARPNSALLFSMLGSVSHPNHPLAPRNLSPPLPRHLRWASLRSAHLRGNQDLEIG